MACCGGTKIPWDEINTPEHKALREMLFPGIEAGLKQGPQTPKFPINAPWDPNFAAGMNMYRQMGGMSPNYQPQQMPMMFNPDWQPKWPGFGEYSPGGGSVVPGPDNPNDPTDPMNQPDKTTGWNEWYPKDPDDIAPWDWQPNNPNWTYEGGPVGNW
jgi:hypothetical protein